jgi:predicted metal-binding protein
MSELQTKDSLLPCPFCGGDVMFCSDTNHACHYVICTSCQASVDLGRPADPTGEIELLADLQRAVAGRWNTRVTR